jgi:hypothetical protein
VETVTLETATARSTRAQIVRELYELIAALDRRVPQVQRVGETSIARAAAALKSEALKRIEDLEREIRPGSSRLTSSTGSVSKPCVMKA